MIKKWTFLHTWVYGQVYDCSTQKLASRCSLQGDASDGAEDGVVDIKHKGGNSSS